MRHINEETITQAVIARHACAGDPRLLGVGMVVGRRVLRTTTGPIAVAGAAAFGSLWIVNVAQTFDPHMTLRGSADVFYPLLALMMTAVPVAAARRPSEGGGA